MKWWQLAVAVVMALWMRAEAGALAPSKPSEMVVLQLGDACQALGTFSLDTRVNPDGTTWRSP